MNWTGLLLVSAMLAPGQLNEHLSFSLRDGLDKQPMLSLFGPGAGSGRRRPALPSSGGSRRVG
jgi:hypothetical protein